MRWYHATSGALALATLGLAACGGGSASSPFSSPAKSSQPGAKARVTAVITIPRTVKRGSGKHGRTYVSPSTLGLIVTVHDSSGVNSYGYDVEANAPGCYSNAQNETVCQFTLNAAVGSDTFDAYTYDKSEGTTNPTVLDASFAATGNLLSELVGYAPPSPIAADTNNTVALTLQAAVATVTASPAVLSVSGNGGTTNSADFEGLDGDTNQISLYPNSATYLNPIAFSITDFGNHSTVASNESVVFDGASSVQPQTASSTPYSASFVGTDSLGNGGYGSNFSYPTASASVLVAPLFLYASTTNAQSGSSVTLYAIAAATPSGASYSITKEPDSGTNNCDAFAVSSPSPAPSPPQVAAYKITSTGASPQTSASPSMQIPCVFDVADATGTVTKSAAFQSGSTNVIITVPTAAPTATATAFAAPTATPTATPTVAPSPTLAPTATPAATATPVPTPTATATTGGTVTLPIPSPVPSTTSTH